MADRLDFAHWQGHEEVIQFADDTTGLLAIVAIHSTALGPALGGTRFHAYPSVEAALVDVLALSRAMSYKNALAGLDHGGGKAVIIADPHRDKTDELLLAYARFVDSLGGRYVTAGDVGTYVTDLDLMSRECRWVTGRSPELGGAGDSSILTAFGVHQGLRACARHRWGTADLAGRRVGVSGLGKVGHRLVAQLVAEGAEVVMADLDPAVGARMAADHPTARLVADTEALLAEQLDVYSPNAMGGAVTDEIARTIHTAIVCGAANNQLADPDAGRILADRGVLYAPDFLVNAGGVIQVADELRGYDAERARGQAATIFDTMTEVLALAEAEQMLPVTAAERLAEARMAAAGSPRPVWRP
jgi:valine dehydrogenase (NAD+)